MAMNLLKNTLNLTRNLATNFTQSLSAKYFACNPALNALNLFQARNSSLMQMHRRGPHCKNRKKRRPLDGAPMLKGVVLKTLIKKPRKPNSGNRKCVMVKLSNGKTKVAHIPGVGHNLQEHNIVLLRCGRLRDVPGVFLKCVRGVYDLPHVIRKPHYVRK